VREAEESYVGGESKERNNKEEEEKKKENFRVTSHPLYVPKEKTGMGRRELKKERCWEERETLKKTSLENCVYEPG